MENKEYYVGIDYGTSNSCIGIYMDSKINIAPNRIGERSTPSLVLFNDKGVFVGEETLTQKIEGNNLINEVKRFIGLDYDDFIANEYDKKLNYEVVNQDNIPKIKININGVENFYTAEEISSFIIKKMVKNAEDFINEAGIGVKITKAIITVPVHFSENQKEAIKSAARLADIEVIRIINEPTAAALSYGFGKDLNIEKEENSKNNNLEKLSVLDHAPLPNMGLKNEEEKIIVLDLGGGTFDISILNCRKLNQDDSLINFETISTIGDNNLGGSDFDNKLLDYCINKFCKEYDIDELKLRNNKNACKRLKIKCEASKKLLSQSNETFINIKELYEGKDFSIKISKNLFEDLCKDLFKKIDIMIDKLLEEKNYEPNNIDFIILVGGATRMTGLRDIIIKKFGEKKIKDNIDPDEAVAFGATLECAKIGKKDKINFNLLDIIPYNLGIAIQNTNLNDINKEDLMYVFIKKFSKIPNCSEEKSFIAILNEENKDINLIVYEGNDKYVKNNQKLGIITINNINRIGEIEYKVKFSIDVNSKLTINIKIDNILEINEEIKHKITNAIVDRKKRKIKILKNKSINPINSFIENIGNIRNSFQTPYNLNDKIEKLIVCSNEYEKLIENYIIFLKDNDYIIEKIFIYTKELFSLYSERISLKNESEKIDNIPEIINKIKNGMINLISVVGYVTELLDIFVNIREDFKNEYYIIFTNFMEIMNNEGNSINKSNKKFRRYYSKLYFEKAYYCCKKYIKEENLCVIERNIKNKLDEQIRINENKLNEINSFAIAIEKLVNGKEYLFGNSGFTLVIKVIEKLENPDSLSEEEIQELLDLFQNMIDVYGDKNCVEKGYCLANIIKIKYVILKDKDYEKLMDYIQNLEFIMEDKEDEDYAWYKEIQTIIKDIKSRSY